MISDSVRTPITCAPQRSLMHALGMTDEEIQMMRKIAVQYVDENRRAKSFVTALKDERNAE